jgi:hypothetical protein
LLLELLDLMREARTTPRKVRDAIAKTAEDLGFDVLPEIHANVRRTADGWEVVAASTDAELLPEPGDGCLRAHARLTFSRAEEPSGVSNKGPENNG